MYKKRKTKKAGNSTTEDKEEETEDEEDCPQVREVSYQSILDAVTDPNRELVPLVELNHPMEETVVSKTSSNKFLFETYDVEEGPGEGKVVARFTGRRPTEEEVAGTKTRKRRPIF